MTDQRSALILAALSGQHLWDWLPSNDNKAAVSHVVSAFTGGSWGQVRKDGIHGAEFIPWHEVLAVVKRGCTNGRRQTYEKAFLLWSAWAIAGGYSPPKGVDKDAHHQQYLEATEAIRSATRDIIEAGCVMEPVQELLW